MSVSGSRGAVGPGQSVASLSTAHESVIGIKATVKRFPTMRVPSVTELSCVGSYQRRCVEALSASPRCVASLLRSVRERSVASASVTGVPVGSPEANVSEYRVPLHPVASASALQSSPRVALAPALQSLRWVARARKCQRIAGRLAQFAVGQPRQQLQ